MGDFLKNLMKRNTGDDDGDFYLKFIRPITLIAATALILLMGLYALDVL